jgi:D-3-phosphoglycerate dehydrogenase
MKIIYVSSDPVILPEHREILNKIGEVVLVKGIKLNEAESIEKLKDADILIVAPSAIPKLSASILNSIPSLKFITTVTTGYDWIDINAAKKRGISISTCKGANARSVAEHTVGMILDLSKRISEFDRDARFKQSFDFGHYQGKEIYNKTIGILGLGDIGSLVAQMANALSLHVLGFNKSQKKLHNVNQVDLQTLLSKSDIISINLPLTSDTREIIGVSEVSQMKNGVILVNTAREELWNKTAVIDGVRNKRIFGLGIETPIMTPLDPNDPYIQYSNILINPHNAFNTIEADKNVKKVWVTNIVGFINGKPQNLIV